MVRLLFCVICAIGGGADVTDRQSRTVALEDGRALSVEVAIGAVRIDGWDRQEAEITIDRRVPSVADRPRLPIEIDETPSRVTVRALQADGRFDRALRAEITIQVPRRALIERIEIMEGRLAINGFGGSVNAGIRRGSIEASNLSGTVRFETGIGSVAVTGARLTPDGLLRLRTFNGDVRLALAERPSDARIMALALNGTIKSEIPLTTKDRWGPRWGETSIGKGEPVISIDVVNGVIEIKAP